MSGPFECHITLEMPEEPDRLVLFMDGWGWKCSWIDGDPLLGEKRFFYLTRYNEKFEDLRAEMELTAKVISGAGYNVVRKKIEQIIYDTKKELA